MIESIKNRIWDNLKEKDVSLAMLYDNEGKILWHRGRKIKGKTVHHGEGFSKSFIQKTISGNEPVNEESVVITLSGESLPYSARILYIKSLLILPVAPGFFLYIDSGVKHAFTPGDLEIFHMMAQMLGETIINVRSNTAETGGFCGSGPIARTIREQIIKYAIEEEPVLLLGETGVGKNYVAELIHRTSGRKGKFVVVHTPSIPESLFESELFGHKKGAFTGASETKKGLVGEAEGGTLLFDEIAEIPLSFQAKLLQLIDVKKYRALGDSTERTADVRIVAATNRGLEDEVNEKNFRKDLFYRLNVLPIEIPPLRDRKEDIPEIVEQYRHFLKEKPIDDDARFIQTLQDHPWPGNVRELINVLKRAGIHLPAPVTASGLADLLKNNISTVPAGTDPNHHIQFQIAEGKSFWDTAWKEFLDREIGRKDMLALLKHYFHESGSNLKTMSKNLNIEEKDYPRFVSALHKYKIHPSKSV